MTNRRIEKAMSLGIGDDGPNILIPVFYGSIDRVLQGRVEGDFDEQVAQVIEEKGLSKDELNIVVEKYKTLPHPVKRYWSSNEYEALMGFADSNDIGVAFTVATNLSQGRAVITRQSTAAKTASPITLELRRSAFAKLQPEEADTSQSIVELPSGPKPNGEPNGPTPVPTPTPTVPKPDPVAPPPGTRYIWDLGSFYCIDPFEDFLGDDLYCVYASGDGTTPIEGNEVRPNPNLIDLHGGSEDIDEGETGNWRTNRIYGAKDPQGHLSIQVDVYDKDYILTFTKHFLELVSSIAVPVTVLIAGPAYTLVGVAVGKALDVIRSHLNEEDDDNYLGRMKKSYPRGGIDIRKEGLGGKAIDFRSWSAAYAEKVPQGVNYRFNYSVTEITP
jgi:hypothetical protein